jgi:hypothetical protein
MQLNKCCFDLLDLNPSSIDLAGGDYCLIDDEPVYCYTIDIIIR